jgi:hypothetical protein
MSSLSDSPFFFMTVVVPLSETLPVAIAIYKYKQFPRELKRFAWYLFLNCTANCVGSILSYHWINNLWLIQIYAVVEIITLSLFFKMLLTGTRVHKYMNAIMVTFVTAAVVNVLFFQHLFTYPGFTKSIESILFIFLTISYFKKVLDHVDPPNKTGNSVLFINSGLLIYFSGSFTLFVISKLIIINFTLNRFVWNTHASLLLIMYMLFAFALWRYKK